MDKKIDRIMFICDTGKKYYINTFAKEDSNRYIVERLGTSDKGIEGPKILKEMPWKQNRFHIYLTESIKEAKLEGGYDCILSAGY